MTNAENLFGAISLLAAEELAAAVEESTGLHIGAAAALVSIGHAPGESIDFLARVLRRSHSSVVRLVSGLVDGGLLARGASPDGRIVSLQLTAKGKQLAKAALQRRGEVMTSILAPLNRAERRKIGELASKLIAARVDDEMHAHWICRLCDGDQCEKCPMEQAFPDDD